jgi:hypothetical protein
VQEERWIILTGSKVLINSSVMVECQKLASVIGGTWIDDRVLKAMNEVAKTVDMHEPLQRPTRELQNCACRGSHIRLGRGLQLNRQ